MAKEAKDRIKINKLLEEAGWRFFDDQNGKANIALENQTQIVTQIEKEQSLVNANKELITLFEQKIKDKIASIWGEDATAKEEVSA